MIFQTKMFNLLHFVSRAQISFATSSCSGISEGLSCAGHKIELHKLNHIGIIESGQVKKITFTKPLLSSPVKLQALEKALRTLDCRRQPLQDRRRVLEEPLLPCKE